MLSAIHYIHTPSFLLDLPLEGLFALGFFPAIFLVPILFLSRQGSAAIPSTGSYIHQLDLTWADFSRILSMFDRFLRPRNHHVFGHGVWQDKPSVDTVVLEVDHAQAVRVEPMEKWVSVNDETRETQLDDRKVV